MSPGRVFRLERHRVIIEAGSIKSRGFAVGPIESKMETPIDQCIREAAQEAATDGGPSAPPLERFLRTGEETWDPRP